MSIMDVIASVVQKISNRQGDSSISTDGFYHTAEYQSGQNVNNTDTYTVPANKILHLKSASVSVGKSIKNAGADCFVTMTIDGTTIYAGIDMETSGWDARSACFVWDKPLILHAGDTIVSRCARGNWAGYTTALFAYAGWLQSV